MAIFFCTITAAERTLGSWTWLVGSGLMLAAYSWIGVCKRLDRRH